MNGTANKVNHLSKAERKLDKYAKAIIKVKTKWNQIAVSKSNYV